MVEKIYSSSASSKGVPFRVLYRSDRQPGGRERNTNLPVVSQPPHLCFRSPFDRLYYSIISSHLSFRLYLHDFLSSRFASRSQLSLFSPLDPSSSFMARDEAMARFKHQYLLEDYQELLKETKEKKERLQKEMQKKLQLLAEVKFLRKKHQSLTKIKRQSHRIPSPSKQVIRTSPDLPLKERNFKSIEAPVPNPRKLIDLNQVSLPNDEETNTFGAAWEDMKMEKLARFEVAKGDDLKLSACREIRSGSNRLGKRRVSWEDQLALRV